MDEDTARQRLLIYTLIRFGGVAIFLFGIAVMYSGILRPGGWPQLGAIIAIVGVLDAFIVPRLVKRSWDGRDQEEN